MKLLKKINKERGTTFVVVTHDERILNFADRVAYIEDGEIKKIEKPR